MWKEFEIAHGNEDTVREMLRIKRSVQATFNVEFNFMTAQMIVPQSSSRIFYTFLINIKFTIYFFILKEPSDSMKSLESAAEAEVQSLAKSKEAAVILSQNKNKNSIQFVT